LEAGKFYFIKNAYFTRFTDRHLMSNSETIEGITTNRPSFYSFQDINTDIYWLIPISSKIIKYQTIYDSFVTKHGRCDKIFFADVLGHKKAFLIQNMFPVTIEYIDNEYINNNTPVRIQGDKESKLISQAKLVLQLHKQGKPVTWPNINHIYKELTGNDLI